MATKFIYEEGENATVALTKLVNALNKHLVTDPGTIVKNWTAVQEVRIVPSTGPTIIGQQPQMKPVVVILAQLESDPMLENLASAQSQLLYELLTVLSCMAEYSSMPEEVKKMLEKRFRELQKDMQPGDVMPT